MARIKSDFMTGRKALPQPSEASVQIVPFELKLAAAPVVGDLIAISDIPVDVDVIDWDIISPQLDTNGVLAGQIGFENALASDVTVPFAAGAPIGAGASGNIIRATSAAQRSIDSLSPRVVSLKWTAAPTGWVGAGKTLLVNLHLKG